MNGNCHLLVGISVGIASCELTGVPLQEGVPIICSVALGSLFPDIDNPTSTMGYLCRPISTTIGVVSRFLGKKGSNHRGIFHDIAIYGLLLYLAVRYAPAFMWFIIGAISHLLLDAFTPAGIPVLSFTKIKLARIPSGSTASIILSWGFAILIIVLGIVYAKTPISIHL